MLRSTEYGTGTLRVDDRADDAGRSRVKTRHWMRIIQLLIVVYFLLFVFLPFYQSAAPPPQQHQQGTIILVPPWILDPKQHLCVDTLILLRHAKSSWGHDLSLMDDFDRPLSAKGVASSLRLGKYLRRHQVAPPDCVVASPSNRTRSTLALVQHEWWMKDTIPVDDIPIDFRHELYDDAPTSYTGFLLNEMMDLATSAYRGCSSSCHRLLLVGHNPAIGVLATTLYPNLTHFSTGGYCEFHLQQGWFDVLLQQQTQDEPNNSAAVKLGTCTVL